VTFEYRPMPDLDRSLQERLGQYPRVPDITLDTLRAVARAIALGLMRVFYHLEVTGPIPDGERIALVANHSSHLDTLAVLASLPRRHHSRIACLAARDYFFERLPRALAASLFAMAVSFDRARYTELRRWSRLLAAQERGWLLVFPSGSRQRAEAHDAILFVLAHSGWTIVPVAIEGTRAAWPVGGRPHPFHTIRVRYGEVPRDVPTKDLRSWLTSFWAAGA
jgi:1-acyl-sn-glycerol-3-phosphate acyltransferase